MLKNKNTLALTMDRQYNSTQQHSRMQTTNTTSILYNYVKTYCLQCFDAVGWAAGRASRRVKKVSGGVLAWLCVWSEMQTCIWLS